ncbi:MAG: phytanoyl-CoA dioxygenase family protein, partial [Chloroflexota bacterium]
MTIWQPTLKQKQQFEEHGYFIERNVISHDLACELKGVIKNVILMPEPETKTDADPMDPMDPMGDSQQARAARYRKLSRFCSSSPLIWDSVHCGEKMLELVRYFLGDDVFIKFDSCFLKPAQTGSATPWHQDNGLWRDGDTEPFNFWMALDPAKKFNGCMQFIPGSHKTEIVPHVLYENSIHGELPRERVAEMIDKRGIHHIELDPGDIVCWHSSLWHFSPPNPSDQSRIAIAGVYSTPEITTKQFWNNYYWVLQDGERITQFPPKVYPLERSTPLP